MDRGAWWATIQGVTKSWTQLNNFTFDNILLCSQRCLQPCLPYVLCLLTQSCPTFATLYTVAHHTPLSMEFSRQEYWSELPFPPPEHLPSPGIEPASPVSPALADKSFTASATCGMMCCV